MATIQITDENFDNEIKKNKVLVCDFWAEWCGPCKQISFLLEEISDEMKDQLVIAKHNIDQEPNTPTKYGIKRDPNNAFLFKDGQLKATKVGATTRVKYRCLDKREYLIII